MRLEFISIADSRGRGVYFLSDHSE